MATLIDFLLGQFRESSELLLKEKHTDLKGSPQSTLVTLEHWRTKNCFSKSTTSVVALISLFTIYIYFFIQQTGPASPSSRPCGDVKTTQYPLDCLPGSLPSRHSQSNMQVRQVNNHNLHEVKVKVLWMQTPPPPPHPHKRTENG